MSSTTQITQPVRQHPRVATDLVVRLESGGRSVLTRAVDLSLAGLAVRDPAGELKGAWFDRVALTLPGGEQVTLRVRLVRREGDTVALTFSELDWDDLFTLARYLSPKL